MSESVPWNERYREENTPWNIGETPLILTEWLAAHPGPGKALIPGCGHGWEIRAFHEAGYTVTALDLAEEAQAAASKAIGKLADGIVIADFFGHDFQGQTFEVVYEKAFLCAIDPVYRTEYGPRLDYLLKPGGCIAGFFYYGAPDGGIPNPMREEDRAAWLEPWFSLESEGEASAFMDNTFRWQVWRKKTPVAAP